MILPKKGLYLGTVDVLGKSFAISFDLYVSEHVHQVYPREIMSLYQHNAAQHTIYFFNYDEVLRIRSPSFPELKTNIVPKRWIRGVNHSLEISGNPYKKSEILYALARNPFEKWEISYAKCWSDLPLAWESFLSIWMKWCIEKMMLGLEKRTFKQIF